MARLPLSIKLDRVGIERIKDFKSLKAWLVKMVVDLEKNNKLQRDVVLGRIASETHEWFTRVANADDVTAGRARAVGNLIVEHVKDGVKTTKREFEAP